MCDEKMKDLRCDGCGAQCVCSAEPVRNPRDNNAIIGWQPKVGSVVVFSYQDLDGDMMDLMPMQSKRLAALKALNFLAPMCDKYKQNCR
jgi:hypothetical protein